MITAKQEKDNKQVAFATSAGIHLLIGLLLFFVIGMAPSNPPIGDRSGGGIEVNLGFDDYGSGDIQPETLVGSEGTQAEEPQKLEDEQPKQETVEPVVTKPEEEL